MVLTEDVDIPSREELTVQEINVSTPYLRAGGIFLGKECEAVNNEFMLCRQEEDDPRKCLKEGKAVTSCALKFFQMVKKNCAPEFTAYATCLDKSSAGMELKECRNTQAIFDSCMLTKLGKERPHYGYLCEPRVHHSKRPKPPPEPPAVYPDALPDLPPETFPRDPSKYGSRTWFGS